MDYSLSSTRKIGKYTQQVLTVWNNADPSEIPSAQTVDFKMGEWTTTLDALNYEHTQTNYRHGALVDGGFVETPSDNLNPSMRYADITLTLVYDNENNKAIPKITTFTVEKVSKNQNDNNYCIGVINDKISELVGISYSGDISTAEHAYITNMLVIVY